MAKIFEFNATEPNITDVAGKLGNVIGNDWDVSRNEVASYIDDSEVIQIVAANVPRIQTGKVLIESASENLARQSSDYSSGIWSKSAVDLLGGQASPDGGSNATLVTLQAGVNQFPLIREQAIFRGDHTVSGWVKYVNRDSASIRSQQFTTFQPSDGTILNGVGSLQRALVNGWIRVQMTFSWTIDGYFGISFLANDNVTEGWDTAGTEQFLVWNFQIESGATSSSDIFTSGATLARPADVITNTVPNTGIGTLTLTKIVDGVESSETVTAGQTLTMENGTSSIIINDSSITSYKTTWTDSVSAGIIGHKIYRDDVEIADVGMGVQVYYDATAVIGETYKYEVQAYSATDETTTETVGVNVKSITVVAAPTNIDVIEIVNLIENSSFEGGDSTGWTPITNWSFVNDRLEGAAATALMTYTFSSEIIESGGAYTLVFDYAATSGGIGFRVGDSATQGSFTSNGVGVSVSLTAGTGSLDKFRIDDSGGAFTGWIDNIILTKD